MNRIVIISCSGQSPAYSLPAAWTARLWNAAGWDTVALVMGHGKDPLWETPRSAMSLREIEAAARVVGIGNGRDPWLPVPSWSHNPGFHACTGCRRVAAATMFGPDDYILIGDADMLPLDVSGIVPSDDDKFTVWGADYFERCNYKWTRWPTCYQGAKASVWKEIMKPRCSSFEAEFFDHMERTKDHSAARYGFHSPGNAHWDCEPGFHAMHDQWDGREARTVLHNRMPNERRLVLGDYAKVGCDHAARYVEPDPIDCHVRDRWLSNANWQVLMDHSPRVPAEMKRMFTELRKEYMAL